MLIWTGAGLAVVLVLWVLYDLLQRQHAILRNFPILGHFRYWLEAIGPELRQYIVTVQQRRAARSHVTNADLGLRISEEAEQLPRVRYGQRPVERAPNYLDHQARDASPRQSLPAKGSTTRALSARRARKMTGQGTAGVRNAFRASHPIVNISSAMSFGSLSPPPPWKRINRRRIASVRLSRTTPVRAESHLTISRTGETSSGSSVRAISAARAPDGELRSRRVHPRDRRRERGAVQVLSRSSSARARSLASEACSPESQGHRARYRGFVGSRSVPTVISPSRATKRSRSVDEMLDFVEDLADATGLPDRNQVGGR